MMFKIEFSYCKSGTPNELEPHQGVKRAGLSFKLGVTCDAQAIHLISWGVMLVEEILRYFMT